MKRSELSRGDIIVSVSRSAGGYVNGNYVILDTGEWHEDYDYAEGRSILRRGKAPQHGTRKLTGVLVANIPRPSTGADGTIERSHIDAAAAKAMKIEVTDKMYVVVGKVNLAVSPLNGLSARIDDYIESEYLKFESQKKSAQIAALRKSENQSVIAEADALLVALGGTKTYTWAGAQPSLGIKDGNVAIVVRALRALKAQEEGK